MIVLGLVGLCLAVAATAVAAQEGQILKRPQAARADPVIESSPVLHHSEIIERTRRVVRNYIDELPNFICTRTTRTSWELPRTAREVARKTVVAEVRFLDGRESYSVVSVNGILIVGIALLTVRDSRRGKQAKGKDHRPGKDDSRFRVRHGIVVSSLPVHSFSVAGRFDTASLPRRPATGRP